MSGKKKSILIVDDDIDMCKTLKGIFEQKGYDTEIASNGLSAVKTIEKKQYDIVLADLIMDKMNGAELLGRVKELAPKSLPYIMTAYRREELLKEAEKNGCKKVFVKPFDVEELIGIFETELEKN
jgi:DNA-binding NtrC family response regulator